MGDRTNKHKRLKRRLDRTESARQWNALRSSVIGLQGATERMREKSYPAQPFTHFRIDALNESGTWKGYVGNGFIGGTTAQTSGDFGMELWSQFAVTHESTDIKLDVTDPPWTDGIKELIEASKGVTLTASTTYYVYLKIIYAYAEVIQNNSTNHEDGCTISFEKLVSIVTTFETSLQESGKTSTLTGIETGGSETFARYWLLGTIKVPSQTYYVPLIGQISEAAIYLPPTYRGRELEAGGLEYGSNNNLDNAGVKTVNAEGTLSMVGGTTSGDVVVTDA